MKEYTHIVIDKNNAGLDTLRMAVDANRLQTAQTLNIQLSGGSMRLEHQLHIFMWDDTPNGVRGRRGIEERGSCFLVRIRRDTWTEDGVIFSGDLKGDGGHNGPPSGKSPNGAWAFKGNISRKYLYIEGLDSPQDPGFDDWVLGRGWPRF